MRYHTSDIRPSSHVCISLFCMMPHPTDVPKVSIVAVEIPRLFASARAAASASFISFVYISISPPIIPRNSVSISYGAYTLKFFETSSILFTTIPVMAMPIFIFSTSPSDKTSCIFLETISVASWIFLGEGSRKKFCS